MNYFSTLFGASAIVVSGIAGMAQATAIDVLWTSGTAAYNTSMQNVANRAATYDPDGDGALSWNLTFWDGSYDPGFSNFDVMVVGSTCSLNAAGTGTGNCGGSNGFFRNGVFADGVLTYGAEIEAARGGDSRTFLSGQDADYHQLNNLPNRDNGPQGFMINAVNWAASGVGLGVVSMTDRISGTNGLGWWTATNSFLADEVPAADAFVYNSETVNIGAGQEDFPVNEGLTSAGLSNWRTASHACFNEINGFDRINFAPFGGGDCGVTIVTAGAAGGDTSGGNTSVSPVPLPAGVWLMLSGFGALVVQRRRRPA